MSLYFLSALVLLLGAVLTVLVFKSYRERLLSIEPSTGLNMDLLKSVFQSTSLEKGLGYGLVAGIGYLIYQIISQGFDFALLMIGATVFTGIVWMVDRLLTKNTRTGILQRAVAEIPEFDEKTDTATLEPGLIENSRAFFPILVFVFLLRSFLVEPFQIPSGSMKPTLEISDFILVNRFAYGIRMPITNNIIIPVAQPERGDVIVFKPPHEPDKNFIKRVVGVPGDLVQFDYNRSILRINGKVVATEYLNSATDDEGQYKLYTEYLDGREHLIYQSAYVGTGTRQKGWIPLEGVVIPEGKFIAMGDNRDSSFDSRYWGFVDENAILGEAFVIWMHWEGFYPSFSRAGRIQ
ncbi:signal peptidase I [Reinekea sp. G2M2-21]|uniref:signal peptidase I n=1 Tax=Reinekea sp. G2M2-21 TaxID=2788942 RepID=UPI0018ABEB83|nr:signal peptidase I [Reinekea sp. G2M2-21]